MTAAASPAITAHDMRESLRAAWCVGPSRECRSIDGVIYSAARGVPQGTPVHSAGVRVSHEGPSGWWAITLVDGPWHPRMEWNGRVSMDGEGWPVGAPTGARNAAALERFVREHERALMDYARANLAAHLAERERVAGLSSPA